MEPLIWSKPFPHKSEIQDPDFHWAKPRSVMKGLKGFALRKCFKVFPCRTGPRGPPPLRGIRFRKHPNANQINLSLGKIPVFERHVQGPWTPTDFWWHYRFLWGSTVIQNFKLCFSCPMFFWLNGKEKIYVFASNSVWGYVNFLVHGPWKSPK